jgi:predicted nucleic acid-binding protein
MQANPRHFHELNVADTCAVWNVLSSRLLYTRAVARKCVFSCTQFVRYECLHKKRKIDSPEDQELRLRLQKEIAQRKQFQCHPIEIEDLQEVAALRTERNLGLGELSSIAFAKRTKQPFLTDDQNARTLAEKVLAPSLVQTTPHLFGWLIFLGVLDDGDKNLVIAEHNALVHRTVSSLY